MADNATAGATVGIDLGTTYSAVAWMTQNGNVEIIPNKDGHSTTPSVVFIDGETVLVGREAVRASALDPDLAAQCFKRDMGQSNYNKTIDDRQFRPEELSAYVLTKLKQDAESTIGPIKNAVITVPAFFDDTRRKATQDAARIAGINTLAIINEPVAAALWHGFNAEMRVGAITMIYDLGGGTFDVTLMKTVGEGKFETIATDGDVRLGGKDWDTRLLQHICAEFKKETGLDPLEDDLAAQELLLRVEDSKRTLSKLSSVPIVVSYGGQRCKIRVSRDKFKELTVDLLEHTKLTSELLLDGAGLSWNDIDNLILVGGSSHMPMVAEMLSAESGREVSDSIDADLAVVKGAAVYSASIITRKTPSLSIYAEDVSDKLMELEHTNVNSHSLGIEIISDVSGNLENNVIIPKNTPIPCKATKEFSISETVLSEETSIDIDILEGEASDPNACIRIGTCAIDGLPVGLAEGSPVEVTFSYSAEGRIQVDAVAKEVNRRASTHIASEHGLSDDKIEEHSQFMLQLNIV